MVDLIKSDFRRVLKDKLFMVVCILAAVFAVITPLLYKLIFSSMDTELEVMTAGLVYAKDNFFGAFSLGNNFGFVMPFLLAIILCKDFSHGTVRNKIISGHSRTNIFLSMYTVCATVLWVMTLLHALLTLGVSLLFFEYQEGPVTAGDLWYMLQSLGFELLVYLCLAAFVSWLCVAMKNVGLVIVLYAAASLGLTMISGILQISIMVLEMDSGSTNTVELLEFFQRINIFNSQMYIGTGTSYELKDVAYNLLVPVIGTAGLLGWGTLKFNRKDLK